MCVRKCVYEIYRTDRKFYIFKPCCNTATFEGRLATKGVTIDRYTEAQSPPIREEMTQHTLLCISISAAQHLRASDNIDDLMLRSNDIFINCKPMGHWSLWCKDHVNILQNILLKKYFVHDMSVHNIINVYRYSNHKFNF